MCRVRHALAAAGALLLPLGTALAVEELPAAACNRGHPGDGERPRERPRGRGGGCEHRHHVGQLAE
jgi:hypothetical protein